MIKLPTHKSALRLYAVIAIALGALLIGNIAFASKYAVLPESTHNLLDPLPQPTASDRILLVSPHPDDETLGAGGYIQQAVAAHAVVRIVLATDGNKHGLKDIRHQEILHATSVLGLTSNQVTFFDYPDSNLSNQTSFQSRLQDVVNTFQPTIILATHPSDIHSDHAAVGRTVDAVAKATLPHPTVYFFVIHYHRFPRPMGYKPNDYLVPPAALVDSSTEWRSYQLSKDQVATKLTALNDYPSQLSLKNPILRDLMYSFVRQNELFAIKTY